MKGLIRFVMIYAVSRMLAPKLEGLLGRIAARTRPGSFAHDTLAAFQKSYSTSILRSLGETVGDLAFGSRVKARRR